MTQKHTPGPWKAARYGGHNTEVRDGRGRRIAATWVQCAARSREGWKRQAATNEANALLIAAAPDLLDALKRMTAEAKMDGMEERAGWDCWISLAEKAIAKAEGGEA